MFLSYHATNKESKNALKPKEIKDPNDLSGILLYNSDKKISHTLSKRRQKIFSSFSKTDLPKKKTFTICIKFGVVKYKKRQKYVRDQWQH